MKETGVALRVLLIDPSRKWLKEAKAYLRENLYEVDCVNNGKEAQLSLYSKNYFAIVLNMKVKNHSGIQVLRFIKNNHPGRKVIVILDKELVGTGEEGERNVYEDDEVATMREVLTKYRVDDALVTPFPLWRLRETIEDHESMESVLSSKRHKQGTSEEEDVYCPDDEFTKIKIDEFYSSRMILFDIFIRLRDSYYIKILHAGEIMSVERVNKYKKDKKVQYLYFRKSDIGKYVRFRNYLTKKMIDNPKIKAEAKVSALKHVSEKFLEQSFYEGIHPRIVDQGKELAENIYNLVSKEKGLYKILRGYQDFDPNAYTHAFLVTLFSTAIIKQFQWQSRNTIESCALACLLHDIGKMKFPKEMIDKRPTEMTPEEYDIYVKHPENGVEIIGDSRLINNSVRQIILQHHEFYDGTGFPYGHSRSKIVTLANIVCLADNFVHLMVDRNINPLEAIKFLLKEGFSSLVRYNPIVVEGLAKSFVQSDELLGSSKKAA